MTSNQITEINPASNAIPMFETDSIPNSKNSLAGGIMISDALRIIVSVIISRTRLFLYFNVVNKE